MANYDALASWNGWGHERTSLVGSIRFGSEDKRMELLDLCINDGKDM